MVNIKFRAWDKNKERWATNYDECYIGEDGNCYAKGDTGGYYSSMCLNRLDADVCFYTGLKDKNGIEIYEGDVVRFWTHANRKSKDGWKEQVIFDECGAWFPFMNPQYTEDEQGDWFDWDNGFEIIGNIYEHPSLLSNEGGERIK